MFHFCSVVGSIYPTPVGYVDYHFFRWNGRQSNSVRGSSHQKGRREDTRDLLRIIRSGNCNSTWHIAPTTPVGQHAADLRAPYWEQQTQVSLAVLCFFRLIIETAIEGGLPLDQVIKKATDIIRTLPYRLAFSALDSIYHDEAPL
ncbi:hypothetical protein H4Q26_010872 [Puccinia striiformis f. sp. tritici PST-130]|nr:hypothetical protein H4Q26_010872 [Puccinia striiformis f. sp. tritici PST-130]